MLAPLRPPITTRRGRWGQEGSAGVLAWCTSQPSGDPEPPSSPRRRRLSSGGQVREVESPCTPTGPGCGMVQPSGGEAGLGLPGLGCLAC